VCARIARLHRDGALEQRAGLLVLFAVHPVDEIEGTNHQAPGIDALGGLALGTEPFDGIEMRFHSGHDALRDVVLDREDVLQLPIVSLGPDVVAGFRVDQLARDANAPARGPDAAFQHVAHAQGARDLAYVDCRTPVNEGRVAGDDEQPAQTRQRRDDVLGDAVRKMILARIAAHVGERQHSDGGAGVPGGRLGRRHRRGRFRPSKHRPQG
jgi:hypothetical protein